MKIHANPWTLVAGILLMPLMGDSTTNKAVVSGQAFGTWNKIHIFRCARNVSICLNHWSMELRTVSMESSLSPCVFFLSECRLWSRRLSTTRRGVYISSHSDRLDESSTLLTRNYPADRVQYLQMNEVFQEKTWGLGSRRESIWGQRVIMLGYVNDK